MKESDKIELRSEEMQDILTRPPHILIRAGISVICGVIVLLLIGSYFFKYPDVVPGEVVITTENPPAWIIAKTSGKIKEWKGINNCRVSKGQLLAVIDNPAFTQDVYSLKESLSHCLISDTAVIIQNELLTVNYELGPIQNSYSAFIRAAINYTNFLSYNTHYKERQALVKQIAGHGRYSDNLEKELKLEQKKLKIARGEYDRQKQLYEKGIISGAEMDMEEKTLVSIEQSEQQLQTRKASTQIEAEQLKESLSKVDTQYEREENSVLSELRNAYRELISSIENWEQAFVLTSPKEGTLTFDTFWAQDQFVNMGDKVLAVVSHDPGKLIGRIKTPASMLGKIKKGHRVNIKVHGYPHMEYGTVYGTVHTISLVPNESFYFIDVELPQALKTNIGKELRFTGELTGDAEVITDDRSLLSRILSPLEYLLKEYM